MGSPILARRHFLQGSVVLAGCGLLAGCGTSLPGWLQAARTRRIGVLSPGTPEAVEPSLEAFRLGLREIGYVEGRDISLDVKLASGRAELLPELAAECVGLPVDVLVTGGTEAIRAAMQATHTIPIVFATAGDPLRDGFVASLARPGGNVTGLTNSAGQVEYTKRLQILREAVPSLTRLAILGYRSETREIQDTVALAQAQGLEVVLLELTSPDAFDAVLGTAIDARADGLFVYTDALLSPLAPRIVAFAERHRLPAIYGTSTYARAGGLLTFGVRIQDNWRRAAAYVDKILKGAKPADLPVEQPTTFDYIVNLKAARAIGLTIPESVMLQATEVIQ